MTTMALALVLGTALGVLIGAVGRVMSALCASAILGPTRAARRRTR
jgi:hypothetical protein